MTSRLSAPSPVSISTFTMRRSSSLYRHCCANCCPALGVRQGDDEPVLRSAPGKALVLHCLWSGQKGERQSSPFAVLVAVAVALSKLPYARGGWGQGRPDRERRRT